jgi:hypothetical protein
METKSIGRRGPSPVLDRYRPVALAVTAIALVSAVLPGAEIVTGETAASVPRLPFAAADASTPDLAVAQQPIEQQLVTASEPGDLPARFSAGDTSPPAFGTDMSSSSSRSAPAVTDDDSERVATPASREPLRLGVTAWATRSAGTPLATFGVPEKSLPVGNRGTLDKASYVRLHGDETVLTLKEQAGGNRGAVASGVVQACQITVERWPGGEAKSFNEAPAFDPASCVAGTRSESGQWLFDVSKFPTPTDDRGFALVPAAGAPSDFQVAFAAA